MEERLTALDQAKQKLLELIELFDSMKHRLQEKPVEGTKDLLFGDVVILNKTEPDPYEGKFIERRAVRTAIPQVYTWLFRQFSEILSPLPGYGRHKEEVFGRLGNTLAMAEADETLDVNEKVSRVFQDFWEICQDLVDGRLKSFDVAFGAEIIDDYLNRSLKSGFVDQATFEYLVFGGSQK